MVTTDDIFSTSDSESCSDSDEDLDNCDAFSLTELSGGVSYQLDLDEGTRSYRNHKATLLGGFVAVWGAPEHLSRKLFIFDIRRSRWKIVKLEDEVHATGEVQVAFLDRDKIYGVINLENRVIQVTGVDVVMTERYERMETYNTPALSRGSAGAFIETRGVVVIYEGLETAPASVHVFGVHDNSWRIQRTDGMAPPRSTNHACCTYMNVLYFAGGRLPGFNAGLHMELYLLDVSRKSRYTWSKPKVDPRSLLPVRRCKLTLTCSGPDRIFAFGGYPDKVKFDYFSFKDSRWYSIAEDRDNEPGFKKLHGSLGNGRYDHAAVQTKSFIMIFGGNRHRIRSPLLITPY